MNVIRWMILYGCVLIPCAGLPADQNPASNTETEKNNAAPLSAQKPITGTIVLINRLKATITVHSQGADHLIGVTVKTGMYGGEKRIRYIDFKKGDNVTVEYLKKVNGKIHAVLIVNNSFKPPVSEQVVRQQEKATSETRRPVVRQPEPDAPVNSKMMVGTLTAVDSNNGTITVLLRGNKYTIGVTPRTRIVSYGRAISLNDFKTGDILAVEYYKNKNGTRFALHINNRNY